MTATASLPQFSLEEVQAHNSRDDCWIIVKDKVHSDMAVSVPNLTKRVWMAELIKVGCGYNKLVVRSSWWCPCAPPFCWFMPSLFPLPLICHPKLSVCVCEKAQYISLSPRVIDILVWRTAISQLFNWIIRTGSNWSIRSVSSWSCLATETTASFSCWRGIKQRGSQFVCPFSNSWNTKL